MREAVKRETSKDMVVLHMQPPSSTTWWHAAQATRGCLLLVVKAVLAG